MGLTLLKGDDVRKRDVTVTKNYLIEKELKSLNRIVTMYLDYALRSSGKTTANAYERLD